jgi:endogenous inhibitor of DNA gyrase (YacG/DUF329 family)
MYQKQDNKHKEGGFMKIKVKCPLCGKRIFDTSQDAKGEIEVKCKNCNKVVKITLNKK